MIFFESPICKGKTFCSACRSTKTEGENFRGAMVSTFKNLEKDFECPFGKPFSDPEVIEERKKETTKKLKVLDICKSCESAVIKTVLNHEFIFCGLPIIGSGKGTCGCLMNVKSILPGMKCPQGKW